MTAAGHDASLSTMTPSRARWTLAAVAGVVAIGAWYGTAPLVTSASDRSDIPMYRAVVAHLRDGAPYHRTIGAELRARGYATREIFNWRTPLHLSTVAAINDAAARAILVASAAGLTIGALVCAARVGPWGWLPMAVLMSGVVALSAAPDLVVMSEAWAGVAIGGSVLAFAFGRAPLGVALGLLALFLRELAAPYCVIATVLAAWRRRWHEMAAWLGGAVAYFGYYAWHVSQVLPLRLATDIGHDTSWVAFGGVPFLLATFAWSGWWFMLPTAWNIVAFGLLAAGLLHPRCPVHVRGAGLAFVGWFLCVGQPFDHYWGLTAAPAWMLGAALGADCLRLAAITAMRGVPR